MVRAVCCVLMILGVSAGTASAFDTAPHFDMTCDVLKSEGFSPTAIQTVQSANFFVDFYEFMGTEELRKRTIHPTTDCRPQLEDILKKGDAQHFDDLDSTKAVAEKWDTMLEATKSTAKARENLGKPDILGLLALLGMSLHNVQDFYTHSNWVEDPPLGPGIGKGALAKYGDHPTWLSMDRKDREALDVYTNFNRPGKPKRSHGDWKGDPSVAINKDWAGRPHYDDAYICAYFATRQWVRLFKTFLTKTGTWNEMQNFTRSSFDPTRDWYYAQKISFYGGHWNGNGQPGEGVAGSKTSLAAVSLQFLGGTCVGGKASALRRDVEDLLLTWGDARYKGPVSITLPSAAPESLRFVQLKVHSIFATDGGDGFMGGGMDWFSYGWIDGQWFMSGLVDGHDQFDFHKKPYYPWTMTKAIPPSRRDIPVMFQMMEDDVKYDDFIDINPRSGKRRLDITYTPATGAVSGDVSTATGTVRSDSRFTMEGKGDCDCARVIMSVTNIRAACLR